jgi:hypothetical protein
VPEVHSLNFIPFFAGLAIVAASIPVTLAVIASRSRPGSSKRRMAWTAAGMSALLAAIALALVVPEGYGSFWTVRFEDDELAVGYWFPREVRVLRRDEIEEISIRPDRASDRLHIRTGERELRSVGFPPGRPYRAIAALESWWGLPISPPEPVDRPRRVGDGGG